LAAAGTVGYLRFAAGRHYPTDILAGALIGSLVGWLVPQLHEIDSEAEGSSTKTKGQEIVLGYGFAF
jgi:membrane-associated phospholipid phosphatase